jgi:hypothetical protein
LLTLSTNWAQATSGLRTALSSLATHVQAARADLAASAEALAVQIALPRTSPADAAALQDNLFLVQSRLAAFTRLSAAADRLQALSHRPAAFLSALAEERQAFSPQATGAFDWNAWQQANFPGSSAYKDDVAVPALVNAQTTWNTLLAPEVSWLDTLSQQTLPTLQAELQRERQLLQTLD